MLNLFTIGTAQNVGKTFITTGLAATMQSLGYKSAVYKPIQTAALEKNGFSQAPDLVFVKKIDPFIQTYFTYMFKSPECPYIAAESEGIIINKNVILKDFKNISKSVDCTITEGNDGILTPIAPEFQTVKLVKELDTPILVIMSAEERTVNGVLSTLNIAEANGISIRGVVINNVTEKTKHIKDFPRLVEEYSNAKIVGVIPHIKQVTPESLITHTLNGIDVESVFNVKIAKLD